MSSTAASHIRLGDWVSGTTAEDERFIGYVEAFVQAAGTVWVYVTDSDRGEIVGTIVESSRGKLSRLPEQAPFLEEELAGLIDLALQTRDEAWFRELSEALPAARRRKSASVAGEGNTPGRRRVFID